MSTAAVPSYTIGKTASLFPLIRYMECVASMPPETPLAFGLHPNTEIGYRTQQCEDLFKTLMESQGAGGSASASKGGSTEVEGEAVSTILLLDTLGGTSEEVSQAQSSVGSGRISQERASTAGWRSHLLWCRKVHLRRVIRAYS